MGDDIKKIGEAEDAEIGGLLKRLDRIEAPKDFNARVMARVAAGRPHERRAVYWWFSRIALPVTGLAVFAFMIWFASVPAPGDLDVAAVPETRSSSVPSVKVDETVPSEPEDRPVEDNSQKPKATTNRVEPTPETRPSSRDFAVTEGAAKTPQTSSNSNRPGFSDPVVFEIREVLRDLGLETEESGDNLVVRSVRANSVAKRSGILEGDRIETMDDRRITKNTQFNSKVEFRTLTVFRNRTRVVIALN